MIRVESFCEKHDSKLVKSLIFSAWLESSTSNQKRDSSGVIFWSHATTGTGSEFFLKWRIRLQFRFRLPLYCCNRKSAMFLFEKLFLFKDQRWSDSGYSLSDPILFLKNDIRIQSESGYGWNHIIRIWKLSENVLRCTAYIFVLCLFCLMR